MDKYSTFAVIVSASELGETEALQWFALLLTHSHHRTMSLARETCATVVASMRRAGKLRCRPLWSGGERAAPVY